MYARIAPRALTVGRRFASTTRNSNSNPWMTPIPLLIIGTLAGGAAVVAHYNDDEHSGIKKIYQKHRNV
ncbi:hypothetical protein RNJ44_00613 [Nakaseomyces bracarensis]|uniref:Uncharacterized protein n=1 Tax=Nakaseomyces bracarensis TaxID=273131 RepID=A0ABR4NRT3_9SACH